MDHFHPGDFKTDYLTVELRKLDPAFDGFRMVHLSDLHVGHWFSLERLAGVVSLVNQLEPDMILMTGDYISYEMEGIVAELKASLGAMRAREAKIAVLGNHDHWLDEDLVINVLHEGGFVVLSNQVYVARRGKAVLQIVGIDSAYVRKDRLPEVIDSISPAGPAILLVHEPDFADQSARSGKFELQLSGHSHGSQIVLPVIGPLLRGPHFWKYPHGLYRIKRHENFQNPCDPPNRVDAGEMLLYTNRGLGTNTLRFRFNCPPEILLITLKSVLPS